MDDTGGLNYRVPHCPSPQFWWFPTVKLTAAAPRTHCSNAQKTSSGVPNGEALRVENSNNWECRNVSCVGICVSYQCNTLFVWTVGYGHLGGHIRLVGWPASGPCQQFPRPLFPEWIYILP